ncbi:MAG: hypothetical protein AAFQ91_33480, partial [Cyanobacteria bacterium J06621_15]
LVLLLRNLPALNTLEPVNIAVTKEVNSKTWSEQTEAVDIKLKANKKDELISYLESDPDDSRVFGYSLAVSHDYLAVGDPGANRVVIYNRQADGNWLRSYEIYPPKRLFGKSRGYGFGYDLALKDNVLMIHAYDYKNLPDFSSKNKFPEEVYLVSLDTSQLKSLQKIKLSRAELYFGGMKFLGDQPALLVKTKGLFGKFTTDILLLDSSGKKIIEDIRITDPDYDNLRKEEVKIDSSNKSLAIILRNRPLEEKAPLLITNTGKIEEIILDKEDINAPQTPKNYIFSIRSEAIKLSEDLIIITVSQRWEVYKTMFWKNSDSPSLIDYVDDASSQVDVRGDLVLLSFSSYQRVKGKAQNDHILIQINEDKAITKSLINWSCVIKDFTFKDVDDDDQYKDAYRGIPAAIVGLIDSDSLILSNHGTVVRVPLKNLSNLIEIKHPKCKE